MKYLLGTGLVSWPSYERISCRYGMIALFRPGKPEEGERGMQAVPWEVTVSDFLGRRGSFIAVLDGQDIDLGNGTFFTEVDFATTYVGLRPDEPREEGWLNEDNLYKVDWLLCRKPVELYFVED